MNAIRRVKQFYEETVQEIRKCAWPDRSELMESTVMVLTAVFAMTLFIWLVDSAAQAVIRFIILQ